LPPDRILAVARCGLGRVWGVRGRALHLRFGPEYIGSRALVR
jgi:hypothetical protein